MGSRHRLAATLVASAIVLGAGAAVPTATAARTLPCTAIPAGNDRVDATCRVRAGRGGLRVRLEARFLGSHDDSKVALADATLDGAPIACGPGSKTESRYEDGDVTLDCRVELPAGKAVRRVGARLAWHHVQLDRIELRID